ncbi:MAG: type IX secretion system membrane protein PorP/SprF [Saprospiraceae bacterium]|nr:type IX secretion system membrane protein PorP/SprF [Saprospiraceae bacterium]
MKRIVYPIILVLFTFGYGFAQEYGAYSQYLVNPVLVNPALTGFNGGHDLLLNYKSNGQDLKELQV